MGYRGHVKNGKVVLDDPIALPEGIIVEVDVIGGSSPPPDSNHGSTLYDNLKPVIGTARGLPPDASTNVDHYLYGQPKQ